jgi:DNA-binding NarL/FixJ family response regulator
MFNLSTNSDNIVAIKVLTAENYVLSAKYLKILLTRNDDVHYLGNAVSNDEIKEYLTNWNADVLLLDIEIPGFDAEESMRFFRETYPQLKIIIYSDFDSNSNSLSKLIKLGASGYISRDADHHQIYEAVKIAYSGSTSFETQLESKVKAKVLESFFNIQ